MQQRSVTRIAVFQEQGAGNAKIHGIRLFGRGIEFSHLTNITAALPPIIDDPETYLPDQFEGDLALSFLKHPDLLDHLAHLCQQRRMPLIAAGKRIAHALTPFTCCGLGRHQGLGRYGDQFGFPELEVRLDPAGRIQQVRVLRGASCGATWDAAASLIGLSAAEALVTYGREVQYLCQADPSAFDPVSGKSAVHYAGHVHHAALSKALTGEAKKPEG